MSKKTLRLLRAGMPAALDKAHWRKIKASYKKRNWIQRTWILAALKDVIHTVEVTEEVSEEMQDAPLSATTEGGEACQ